MTSGQKARHTGHCRCGGVAISVMQKPSFSGYCHCDDCRRSNGAPLVSFAGFGSDGISWTARETLADWRNGSFTRQFCGNCGSPVAYLDDAVPEIVFFYTAFMSEPEAFPPESHSYCSRRISWLQLTDDLPKFENTSYPRTQ